MVYRKRAHRKLRRNKWVNGRIRRYQPLPRWERVFFRSLREMVKEGERRMSLWLNLLAKRPKPKVSGRFIIWPVKGRSSSSSS